ncbi:MAG: SURF1 family protein [Tetrasphaera sp.]
MLRTALKPRWLALLGLVVLIVIAFIQLGRWQLGVAQDKARVEAVKQAGQRPVVDLTTLLRPHQDFPPEVGGRMITTTGSYAAGQVLVDGRLLDGTRGYWVITPFTVESTGATLAMLRGWTPTATTPPPPQGSVTVRASLAPGESPSETGLPEGHLSSVDLARLVNRWHGDLYNGFGFVQDEQPTPLEATTAGLTRVPPPVPASGVQWRNAAYALQWWVFAAFAVYLWLRMVHLAAKEERAPVIVKQTATKEEASLP